jgi:hypothetical protein
VAEFNYGEYHDLDAVSFNERWLTRHW